MTNNFSHFYNWSPCHLHNLKYTLFGHGPFISDVDHNDYVDFANTLNLPFGHEKFSIDSNPLINSGNYFTTERLKLINTLCSLLPHLSAFQFRSSGAESVEAALRYIRNSFSSKPTIFSIEGSYHGLTLGAQQLMGKVPSDENLIVILPFPTEENVKMIFKIIEDRVQHSPVAIVFEVVQGNHVRALPANFLHIIMELKSKYPDRVLLCCDDMLCSIRLGNWCSAPNWLNIDIFIAGKSWSGGFPFSLFGINNQVRSFAGDILGTTTYGGNPIACEMVLSTIKRIQNNSLFSHIKICETLIFSEGVKEWEQISSVYRTECHGLLFGIEMQTIGLAQEAAYNLLKEGLLCTRINKLLRFSPALSIPIELLTDSLKVITFTIKQLAIH